MEVYSAKEKDAVLFEIVKAHPKNFIVEDNSKKEIVKEYLLPYGYIEILVKVEQGGGMIVCQATQKGIDFITKGGYVREEKVDKSLSFFEKIKKNTNKIAIEVAIAVIVGLILYYIFGIKSS